MSLNSFESFGVRSDAAAFVMPEICTSFPSSRDIFKDRGAKAQPSFPRRSHNT
jgi:hypothetical protein